MGHRITYIMLFTVVKAFALLPWCVLYLISDFIFLLLYHIAGYRRKVVESNLSKCFPEKSADSITSISKEFYHNFADYMVETVKLAHISDKAMSERMVFENIDILDRMVNGGRSIVCYFSHCGNWEWATSITLHSQASLSPVFCQIYRPLRNEVMDQLMLRLRGRFGSVSLPKKTSFRHLLKYKLDNIITVTGFMSDQKPSHGDAVHIVNFLNRPTAVITGTEQLGRKLGMGALYLDMHKISRGHYKVVIRHLSDNIADEKPMSVTDRYFKLLEKTIRREPAIWLWSHNRWKNPVEMPVNDTPDKP